MEMFSTIRDEEGRKEVMIGSDSLESSSLKIEVVPITSMLKTTEEKPQTIKIPYGATSTTNLDIRERHA